MRTFGAVLAAVLLTVPGVVLAQTTNCTYGGGSATCYTNRGLTGVVPAPDYSAYWRIQQEQQAQFQADLRDQAAARQEREQAAQAQSEAEGAREGDRERLQRSQAVGQMIADHRCEDARLYALNTGDLTLAAQVATLCPATPTPAK